MKKLLIIPFLLLTINLSAESQTSRIDKNLTIYTDVMRQLDINYVDTLNYDDLIESSINQMLRKVDPNTIYIPKSEDDELRRMTQGKYGGVGSIIMYRDSLEITTFCKSCILNLCYISRYIDRHKIRTIPKCR